MNYDKARNICIHQASLIISVYKSEPNLRCILESLRHQTYKHFEVIVSEDGSATEIALLIETIKLNTAFSLKHLTQPDRGFRKNRALNAAIRAANADLLIFIDGDCVPHPRFIESHINEAHKYSISTGRRVELGSVASRMLMNSPSRIKVLGNPISYSFALPFLLAEGIKNPESGYFSKVVHSLVQNRHLSIVGCNFSCSKQALIDINGFNEDYEAPGIGEDSDLEWRFIRAGYKIKNVKFLTPIFHLWHVRSYSLSSRNQETYAETKALDQWFARRGLFSID
jgi:glycosyltransferase involved in cell wall biosynthesis